MINNTSFYSRDELLSFGFSRVGKNVLISRNASIFTPQDITLGDNVRVDDFCILSGKINFGSYVHVSAYVALYAKGGIEIGDYCGISPKSIVFTASDDFSGSYMISPMVPLDYCNVTIGRVVLNNYAQLGAASVVMPGVVIGEGAVTGAYTFVNRDLEPWTINIGIPTRVLRRRKRDIVELSKGIL